MPWTVSKEEEPLIDDLEFFIKWSDKSHLHNTWCTFKYLVNTNCGGVRKVEIFFRKMQYLSQQLPYMTNDEIECQNITLEFQRQIDLDSLIAERIIRHRVEYRSQTLSNSTVSKMIPYKTSPPPTHLKENDTNEEKLLSGSNVSSSLPDSLTYPSSEKHEPHDAFLDGNGHETNETSTSLQFQKIRTDMYYVKWTNSQYDQCTW
jgi:hypothetical protein